MNIFAKLSCIDSKSFSEWSQTHPRRSMDRRKHDLVSIHSVQTYMLVCTQMSVPGTNVLVPARSGDVFGSGEGAEWMQVVSMVDPCRADRPGSCC